jgi:hypothetical protein
MRNTQNSLFVYWEFCISGKLAASAWYSSNLLVQQWLPMTLKWLPITLKWLPVTLKWLPIVTEIVSRVPEVVSLLFVIRALS